MIENPGVFVPFLFGLIGTLIGWWGAVIWHDSQVRIMKRKTEPYGIIHSIEPGEPVMRRPAEFGPIAQSREYVERIRDAIVEDQLGTRRESPAQRRRRMQKYRGYTDRQRVQHWLLHWREDYMAALTGRGLAFE